MRIIFHQQHSPESYHQANVFSMEIRTVKGHYTSGQTLLKQYIFRLQRLEIQTSPRNTYVIATITSNGKAVQGKTRNRSDRNI